MLEFELNALKGAERGIIRITVYMPTEPHSPLSIAVPMADLTPDTVMLRVENDLRKLARGLIERGVTGA